MMSVLHQGPLGDLVLEEEEGSNTDGLRDPLDKKKKKKKNQNKETNSSRSRECVAVREPGGRHRSQRNLWI